ncbi:hypothetical protein ACFE04_023121 [Oxalis oulophora]
MEGIGSARLGRISSRYGGSSSVTATFNGPVRKWKKKWVHVSSTPLLNLNTSNRTSTNRHKTSNNNYNNNDDSKLVLCRWTPLSPSITTTDTGGEYDDKDEQQPPKKRFRYTPVAVLKEKQSLVIEKIEGKEEAEAEAFEKNQFTAAWPPYKVDKPRIKTVSKNEAQVSSEGSLDLDLCLKGRDSFLGSG